MVYWNGIEQDIARPSAGGSNVPHSFKNSSSWIADVIIIIYFFLTLPYQAFLPVVRDLPLLPRHRGALKATGRLYKPSYTHLETCLCFGWCAFSPLKPKNLPL